MDLGETATVFETGYRVYEGVVGGLDALEEIAEFTYCGAGLLACLHDGLPRLVDLHLLFEECGAGGVAAVKDFVDNIGCTVVDLSVEEESVSAVLTKEDP